MAVIDSTRETVRHNFVPADSRPLLGRLGPWQLVRLLNEGNFTRVYQARPADELDANSGDGGPRRAA